MRKLHTKEQADSRKLHHEIDTLTEGHRELEAKLAAALVENADIYKTSQENEALTAEIEADLEKEQARLKALVAELKARVVVLEEELAAAQAATDDVEEIDTAELEELRNRLSAALEEVEALRRKLTEALKDKEDMTDFAESIEKASDQETDSILTELETVKKARDSLLTELGTVKKAQLSVVSRAMKDDSLAEGSAEIEKLTQRIKTLQIQAREAEEHEASLANTRLRS